MRIERYVFAKWKLVLLAGAFAACSVSALLAAPAENLLAWWSFDQIQSGRTLERAVLIEDVVGGNYKQPPGVLGKALQFDGFTTEIVRLAAVAPNVPAHFTLEAWVALEAYPLVNLAMVVRIWGPAGATLQINGQPLPRGARFRYGHRHELEGSTLLVSIRCDTTDPMTIQLTPEPL